YYALAGIFKSTRTMETFKKVARWHENPLATAQDRARQAEHLKRVAEQKNAIQALGRRSNQGLPARSGKESPPPKGLESLDPAETQAEQKRLREALTELEKSAPVLPTAMGVTEGHVADVRIHIRGSQLAPRDTLAR